MWKKLVVFYKNSTPQTQFKICMFPIHKRHVCVYTHTVHIDLLIRPLRAEPEPWSSFIRGQCFRTQWAFPVALHWCAPMSSYILVRSKHYKKCWFCLFVCLFSFFFFFPGSYILTWCSQTVAFQITVSRTVIHYTLFMSTGKGFQVQAICKRFQVCIQPSFQKGGFETTAWEHNIRRTQEQIIPQGSKESEGNCPLNL